MQIECPNCKEWTDADTGICAFCGAVLCEKETQEDEYLLPDVPQETKEEAVKNYLKERRALRIRTVLKVICFVIGCTVSLAGMVLSKPWFILWGGIAVYVGLCLSENKSKRLPREKRNNSRYLK